MLFLWASSQSGNCKVENLVFTINDHVVQANYPAASAGICTPPRMTIPNIPNGDFEALQFHIHLGSEHALDGKKFGADFHLVHKQVNGSRFAVLGLFLDPAPAGVTGNAAFSGLIDGWSAVDVKNAASCKPKRDRSLSEPAHPNVRQTQATFDVYGMVPVGFSTYYYQGSLTTPPCSEVVNWNVVDKPVLLAPKDYAALFSLILNFVGDDCTSRTIAFGNKTARPIQARNGRTVTRKCPKGVGECDSIVRLDLWNADTDTLNRTNVLNGAVVCREDFAFSIQAVVSLGNCVNRLRFTLRGPNGYSYTNTERTAPYFLFTNLGSAIKGRTLSPGTYTLTATPNNKLDETKSLTFEVKRCRA
jgi:carbonic anhydrase